MRVLPDPDPQHLVAYLECALLAGAAGALHHLAVDPQPQHRRTYTEHSQNKYRGFYLIFWRI